MRRFVWVAAMLVVTLLAMAKQKPSQYGRGTGKVYLFGVSQQLTDSVVYVTFINEVDSFDLAKKTKFLPFRSEFSLQLKEYMEGNLKKDHQTTVVFYSTSRKKLSKKYYKIKKRYLDNPYTKIVPIDGFRFRHPLESFVNEKE
ncbi:MAG: hypothetical protein J5790_00825 [Bacteroidaceae bacterium]|nr:hypothetical protein [Bacteroidaceae bacterium]